VSASSTGSESTTRNSSHTEADRENEVTQDHRVTGQAPAILSRCTLLLRSLCLSLLLWPVLAAQAQTASTTTLTSSSATSTYGGNVTFTATVVGTEPTGSVSFMDGATQLGTAALSGSGNSRTATLTSNAMAAGTRSITAVYAGDTSNSASTSPVRTQTVNKANVTVSGFTVTPNPVNNGQNMTFTATVTGVNPTGVVRFADYYAYYPGGARTIITSAPLTGSGNTRTATVTISSTGVSSSSWAIAVYAGDSNHNSTEVSGGDAQSSFTVVKQSTTVTLASSANPSIHGNAVTLTATVNGGTNPTGTVAFLNGTTELGRATLNNRTATLSVSSLAVSAHALSANYWGDVNNNTATSATLTQTVNKVPTSTVLTSSGPNPTQAGQPLTLSATVSGGSNAGGTVTFRDGATTLGTVTLPANRVAVLNNARLSGGSRTLTAVYSGDTLSASSTSAAVTQDVSAVPTTLSLTSSGATASQGQNVTLTARVNGGYIPGGLVTFSSGSTALGTASVAGGAATFSINSLGVGSHTLSAAYAGDSSNQASSSGSVGLTVNPRAGMTWQYGYDAMGRINTMVDPNGNATYIYYDSLGRPIQTQQPPNEGTSSPTVIGMSYNLADSLTQVTDPRNLATTYSPNGLGKVTAQNSPDTGATQYSYDAKGNVLSSTDSRGKTTTYVYDALDRVTRISYPTGVATAFEYDGGSSGTAAQKGELTKMTDESGQTTYSHDAWGRLTGKTTTISGKSFTTSYGWGDSGSALDKLTSITYPSGTRVNYSYDAQGYLSGITVNPVNANGVGTSGTAIPLLSGISYNAENKITGWLWSDSKVRTIAYDSNGQISAYSLGDPLGTGATAGTLRTLNRDAAGRITGYSHTNNGSPISTLNQGFAYDKLNRLLSASLNGTSTQYSYDATGNRTSKTIAGTSYSNTVQTTSNRLTQTQDVNGTATLQYDAAGHITNDGTNTFTYSDRGRMTSASNAGGTVNYLYNGYGQRVYKSGPTAMVPTGAAYYLYDEQGQLLGEYDSNGAPVYETIYLGSLPVGVQKQTGTAANSDIQTTVYNVHADQIATARVITQQDQTIVWRWDTAEAFGGTLPDQNPNGLGTFTFNQRFPGQVFDAETGLFQNWNREYNARQGRYIQSDPIGLAGGINTFAYVEGDPLSYTDPTGLCIGPLLSACVWAAANAPWIVSSGTFATSVGYAIVNGAAPVASAAAKAAAPAACVANGIANPVPLTLARVIPNGMPATTLGRPGASDVFVTGASDIAGMSSKQIAQRLAIPESSAGFKVIEFATPRSGIASPVFRSDPGFIGGGRTAGGAREFVIPNGPIPADAIIRTVP
jgi:RHS repeat-associated protein